MNISLSFLFFFWPNPSFCYRYKGGVEANALKRGRMAIRIMRKKQSYHDRRRMNRKEFHVYINKVCDEMAGGEEVRQTHHSILYFEFTPITNRSNFRIRNVRMHCFILILVRFIKILGRM